MSTRTVLITGAAGHLGRALAAAFESEGANLVLVDRELELLQRAFGSEAAARLLAPCDLLDATRVQAVVDSALARFGRIDVLCNIAGGFSMGSSLAADALQQYDHLMALNAGAVFKMVTCAAPSMLARGTGSIVNIGAQSALTGQANMAAYCASKSAVIRMTESFAAEFKPQGVRVNCLLPRIIDTPQNRKDMPDADFAQWTTPEKIAQVIGFLASEYSTAASGASIAV